MTVYKTQKQGASVTLLVLETLWIIFGVFSLKTKGLDISAKGVSIKTQKRFDREHYVDATQRCVRIYVCLLGFSLVSYLRGFVRAMGASSFGKADAAPSPGPSSAGMYRQASSSGSADFEEKKKRGLFHRGLGSKEKL